MKFNANKFELIRYGQNEQMKMNTLYFTPDMESVIEEKSQLRDLGIIMSNDMKFSHHVSKICKTVRQKTGCLQTRILHETDVEISTTTTH